MNENLTGFASGSFIGVLSGFALEIPDILIKINPVEFAMEFPVRLIATMLLAFLGGVAGLIGKDWYTYNFKPWLKRKKILK